MKRLVGAIFVFVFVFNILGCAAQPEAPGEEDSYRHKTNKAREDAREQKEEQFEE